jgi:hypothetical protein
MLIHHSATSTSHEKEPSMTATTEAPGATAGGEESLTGLEWRRRYEAAEASLRLAVEFINGRGVRHFGRSPTVRIYLRLVEMETAMALRHQASIAPGEPLPERNTLPPRTRALAAEEAVEAVRAQAIKAQADDGFCEEGLRDFLASARMRPVPRLMRYTLGFASSSFTPTQGATGQDLDYTNGDRDYQALQREMSDVLTAEFRQMIGRLKERDPRFASLSDEIACRVAAERWVTLS